MDPSIARLHYQRVNDRVFSTSINNRYIYQNLRRIEFKEEDKWVQRDIVKSFFNVLKRHIYYALIHHIVVLKLHAIWLWMILLQDLRFGFQVS